MGSEFAFPVLSPASWRRFSRTAWNRRPHLWAGLGALASAGSLFRAMTDVRSAVDGGASGTQLRFFIDRTLANEPRHWLSGADVDCHGYCARIEKRLHGREYVLVASGLQVNFELWTALSRFLRGLFAITGIPPYTVEADSFLGNYHSTVFGIHRDKVGVLMSVVEGYKRMRFWLPDELTPADATRRRHRYGSLLPRALTIEARPGDLVYWPANFWHVAEPAGPSLSLHVGLGTHGGTFANPDAEGTPSERIVSAVRDLFGPDDARPLPLEPRATDSIRDARRVARIFSGADAAYRQLAPLLVGRYLSRVTAVGFDPPPPPLRRSWLRDGTVRANGGPLLWRRLGRTIVISANGHAFTAPFHGRLVRLLDRLNRGATIRVEGARSASSSDGYPALAREVLSRLHRLRGVTRVPAMAAVSERSEIR